MKSVALAVMALATLSACGAGDKSAQLIGTWKCTLTSPEMTMTGTVTYASDGKSTSMVNLIAPSPQGRVEAVVSMIATWKLLSDGRIEEEMTSVNVPAASLDGQSIDPSGFASLLNAGIGQKNVSKVTITNNTMNIDGDSTQACTR